MSYPKLVFFVSGVVLFAVRFLSAVEEERDFLGSYSLSDRQFGTIVTVTVDSTNRTIVTNALPNHETGQFPNAGNPNTIREQSLTYMYPVNPNYIGNARFARIPGVAVNGVPFEPGTAESVVCESGESYRIEALQEVYDLGFDFNDAHVQPSGLYHYHGISSILVEVYDKGKDIVHIGFAADGHLLYFSKGGNYQSSYKLSTSIRTGSDCMASRAAGGVIVDVDGTNPDGTYDLDWIYEEGSGNLDACNGATINGEYVYFLTNEYPYIPRCLNGEFAEVGQSVPPPGGRGPGGPPPGGRGPGGPPLGGRGLGGPPLGGPSPELESLL